MRAHNLRPRIQTPTSGDVCRNPTLRGLFGFLATLVLILTMLGLSSCAGTSSATLSTPSAGALSPNFPSVSFGNVLVGSAMTQNLSVTNTGTATVSISQTTSSGSGFTVVGGSAPTSIPVGQVSTIQVQFAPQTAGAASGNVSIVSNASNSPLMIPLSGTGTQAGLTISPTSVNFGNVTVGQNGTQSIMFTNNESTSVVVSSAVVSGSGFSMSSLALPVTISASQNITFQATFTPTGTGSITGSISVVSTATNSPGMINLSGTGVTSGSGSSACTGEAIPQTQTNVTSTLGILSGAVVMQLTSAASPLSSWNTYADVPLVATATNPNVLVTNYGTNPNGITISNPDGTNAQQINGIQQGIWVIVSVDGKWIAYQGQNTDNTTDLYAINLTAAGTCAPTNLSNLHLSLTPPLTSLVYSTSQIDPTTGLNVFAFSEGVTVRTVESDGSHLQAITMGDPLNGQVLHRMRLNPVFPNKIWYKRDAANPNPNGTATPEIWVSDITDPTVVYNAAIVGGVGVPADHNSWSPDGTTIGFDYNGSWYTIQVLNTDGTWVNGGNFGSATLVGPPAASGLAVDYCSWAPDGSEYVCTRGPNPAAHFGGEIYLMSLDGQTTTLLASANSTGNVDNGIPKAHFGDMQHIYFSSDASGIPQVYSVTGFTAP
jgi:hypothetical protein